MTHPNKPLTQRVVIHYQKKTNKKALHSQKRDSDLWVRQKWPIWAKKIAYSLQNAEINEKVSRKFGYVGFFCTFAHVQRYEIWCSRFK